MFLLRFICTSGPLYTCITEKTVFMRGTVRTLETKWGSKSSIGVVMQVYQHNKTYQTYQHNKFKHISYEFIKDRLKLYSKKSHLSVGASNSQIKGSREVPPPLWTPLSVLLLKQNIAPLSSIFWRTSLDRLLLGGFLKYAFTYQDRQQSETLLLPLLNTSIPLSGPTTRHSVCLFYFLLTALCHILLSFFFNLKTCHPPLIYWATAAYLPSAL